MLSVDKGLDPLLKRPFSLHRFMGNSFQILYRVVGKATNMLKDKEKGDIIDVTGPLGNGFPLPRPGSRPLLVAGGIGVAPMFAMAETVRDKKPVFFLGAKSRKEILCVKGLKSIGISPVISTDNGTQGKRGLITDVLRDFLSRQSLASCEANGSIARLVRSQRVNRHCLYACGPKPMLRELSTLAREFDLKGYLALEENMACGIGACLSCVVNTTNGFRRICKEGPVFSVEEIIW